MEASSLPPAPSLGSCAGACAGVFIAEGFSATAVSRGRLADPAMEPAFAVEHIMPSSGAMTEVAMAGGVCEACGGGRGNKPFAGGSWASPHVINTQQLATYGLRRGKKSGPLVRRGLVAPTLERHAIVSLIVQMTFICGAFSVKLNSPPRRKVAKQIQKPSIPRPPAACEAVTLGEALAFFLL